MRSGLRSAESAGEGCAYIRKAPAYIVPYYIVSQLLNKPQSLNLGPRLAREFLQSKQEEVNEPFGKDYVAAIAR